MTNLQRARVSALVAIAFYAAVAVGVAAVVAGMTGLAGAQVVPAFQRVYSDPPISVVVVRRPVAPGGQTGPAEPVGNTTAEQSDRVLDYLAEPGYSYVTACQFTRRDPVTYWWTGYLPLVVPGSRRRVH